MERSCGTATTKGRKKGARFAKKRYLCSEKSTMDNKQTILELGTKPVGRLLWQYAFPSIVAMTAASIYNIVDSIFIGQGVGPLAISGLAITFPLMNITAAFGAAVGAGTSTCMSVKLGQRDYACAERVLGNSMSLNIIISLVVGFTCLIFLDPILRFFGASDNTLPYARDYMFVLLLFNVVAHLHHGMSGVLRAVSKPKAAMYITICAVLVNTLLDPLFIYAFDMGIRGAAIATMLAQGLGLTLQLSILSNRREPLHLHRGIYKLYGDIVKNIVHIGLSPFLMNVCACTIVIIINTSMVHYGGDLAVGAFGIANRVVFIFLMVNMGINQGMQPIAGYNYGAQRFDRLMRVLTYAIVSATAVTVVGFVIAVTIPDVCARLFTTDAELAALSAHGITFMAIMFPVVGYQVVITNFFQSIGKANISIFLSLSRQLLFLLPMLLVLPPIFGIDGVWASMPAADALAAIVAAWIMGVYMRKFKRQHRELSYAGKEDNNQRG